MSRTNYIFIDFENVQEIDLDRIKDKPVKVILVLGERHRKLEVALVKQLLEYAPQVTLVETGRGGKNALDLVLSERIGETKKTDPRGYFHILSGDKDFDALIGYLKDNGTPAARRAAFSEIPILMNNGERVEFIIQYFATPTASGNKNTRPTDRKALESHIQHLFGKALTDSELSDTIAGLVARKAVAITDKNKVQITLP